MVIWIERLNDQMADNGVIKRAAIHTLGCKVNQYDSDAVGELFAAAGYRLVDFHEEADVYIVNTCTVTSLGDKKSRQMVRRARRRNPNAKVVMMGCFAQASPEEAANVEGVNLVLGTDQRQGVVELVEALAVQETQMLVHPIFDVTTFEELSVRKGSGRTRAVLKIQDGCNEFCTYCKIPFARGRSRSRDPEQVLEQAAVLGEQGFAEIVLTGIHLGAYGLDLEVETSLAQVMKRIADETPVKRLRLSSIDPDKITDDLLRIISTTPQICRHLHIPLQSGSASVLQRMRRNYTASQYDSILKRVRQWIPDAAITTDVIVGFPGETDAEFMETVEFVNQADFTRLHVFPFSARQGTPAAKMADQIPKAVRTRRAGELMDLGKRLSQRWHETFIGREVAVLVEQSSEGCLTGFTDQYVRVLGTPSTQSPAAQTGQIVEVQVIEADYEGVAGILCSSGK